jgi:hypothetical protein
MYSLPILPRAMLALLCITALGVAPCFATQIWDADDGTLAFVKPAFADPTLPANQDAITQNVAITRGVTKGIYNAVSEAFYTNTSSPADTAWAFSGLNLNPAFSFGTGASSHGSLTFADWETSHGINPLQTVGLPAVVHLVTDDIYIDIQFDSWGRGPVSGAFFSYVRASDPLAADFDGDGDVDNVDLTHPTLGWETRFGVDLDGLNFLEWQREYGTDLSPPATAIAIPEPTTSALALVATLFFTSRPRP